MAQHESSTNDTPTIPVFDAEDLAALEQLIDEHEEEVIEEGETVRRKGIYLLPNLFTTGALFAGFYAVIAAVQGDFEAAPIAIFFAMVFDGLDGRALFAM
jgi:CDP-diacylglycerol--serine O-phosphatidyltransferase